MFLETAPYLSPSGVHLPRLKVPLPLYLLIGRAAAFQLSSWLATHAPRSLLASHDDSAILAKVKRGETPIDDLDVSRHVAESA